MCPSLNMGTMALNVWEKQETIRCAVYRLLHTIYSYPGHETMNFLKGFTLADDYYRYLSSYSNADKKRLLGSLSAMVHWGASGPLEDMEVEYTRLFISSFNGTPAKPYESVHVEKGRIVLGETTVRVREFYRRFGVDLGQHHPEPADHIAIETEFMAYLIEREMSAYLEGNIEEADRFRDAQARFLMQHLLCWAWNFSDKVHIYSLHPFYREAGMFSKIFFEIETPMNLRFTKGNENTQKGFS
ncbi:molecular chaperone TorD family protein [bacterium]|nr:molecular chaperone TorD family protein [bacterium]